MKAEGLSILACAVGVALTIVVVVWAMDSPPPGRYEVTATGSGSLGATELPRLYAPVPPIIGVSSQAVVAPVTGWRSVLPRVLVPVLILLALVATVAAWSWWGRCSGQVVTWVDGSRRTTHLQDLASLRWHGGQVQLSDLLSDPHPDANGWTLAVRRGNVAVVPPADPEGRVELLPCTPTWVRLSTASSCRIVWRPQAPAHSLRVDDPLADRPDGRT